MNKFVILCWIALCGASYSAVEGASTSRIVGGNVGNDFQFRYMVSLQRTSEVNELTRGHRCGGAMITYSHALTAASCLYNNNTGTFTLIAPREYRLFAGLARLDHDSLAGRVRNVLAFTVHPQFVPTRRFNDDIAVITTSSPFSHAVVNPLPVPTTDITVTNPSVCNSAGWGGQNGTASASYQLMFTQSRVTLGSHCAVEYHQLGTPISMQSSMLCARPITNSSGCQGDIGNPLVCNSQLHGILFLSKDCSAELPITPIPDVYTRVFSYRAWLNETVFGVQTDGASTYQPGIGLLVMFVLVQIVTTMS